MFVFDVREITTYEDFFSFLTTEKNLFLNEKNRIFDKYNFYEKVKWDKDIQKYQLFRNEYHDLVQQIIKDVIAKYRIHLPEKCLITEFGSFVKRTERIYSDIDITFCYDEVKLEKYENVEELISYTITSIFDFTIDHFHGNFQHFPLIPEFDTYTEENNTYCLQFENKNVLYKCGPETLKENLTNIKNVRDYKTLITSFEIKHQKKRDIDSLYSIKILENTTEHDFHRDLSQFETKYNICEDYIFDFADTILSENFSISELKKILKNLGIVQFYIFIAKIRSEIPFTDSYFMNIEMIWENKLLEQFLGKEYICALHSAFITFIFFWNRIEVTLKKVGIPLSTRCYKLFSISEINQLLESDWGNNTKIENIIESKNELINLVEKGMNLLCKK